MTDTNPDINLYAVVELMGHRTRAGIVSDAQMGGATLLRIEHPTPADGEPPAVEYYAPAAIFSIRPCTREETEKVVAWAWRTAVPTTPELAPVFAEVIDHEDFDDDEEDFR